MEIKEKKKRGICATNKKYWVIQFFSGLYNNYWLIDNIYIVKKFIKYKSNIFSSPTK